MLSAARCAATFRRTEEARELDIFMFASDALAHEFAKLGSGSQLFEIIEAWGVKWKSAEKR
jgi:hypothetical protein